MVKLYDTGVFLANGKDLITDPAQLAGLRGALLRGRCGRIGAASPASYENKAEHGEHGDDAQEALLHSKSLLYGRETAYLRTSVQHDPDKQRVVKVDAPDNPISERIRGRPMPGEARPSR